MADTETDRSVVAVADAQPPGAAVEVSPAVPDEFDGEGGVMTLREHLTELRDRLVRAVLGLVAGCVVGYLIADRVLLYLASQLCDPASSADCRLAIIDPAEGMITYFKVSLYVGIAVSLPIIAYQIIRFMSPGLTRKEKRLLYAALPFVGVLFAVGSAFAVFLVLPAMLRFLTSFQNQIFRPDLRAAATVSLGLTVTLWMGLVFELPLVMVILARLRIVHWRRMLSWWRYAIVLILIVAAIITPTPDPVNMSIVAVPMFILYALGVALARLFGGAASPSSLPTSVAP
jgi:sec-independent protein translocase protein TatC